MADDSALVAAFPELAKKKPQLHHAFPEVAPKAPNPALAAAFPELTKGPAASAASPVGNALKAVSDVFDAPVALAGAAMEGRAGEVASELWNKHNFSEVNERENPFHKQFLDRRVAEGSDIARLAEEHPVGTAIAEGAASFANPLNYLPVGRVAKGLGALAKVGGRVVDAGMALMPATAKVATAVKTGLEDAKNEILPFRRLETTGGEAAGQAGRTYKGAQGRVTNEVNERVKRIFDGMTPEQAEEISRVARAGAIKGQAVTNTEISKRAADMKAVLADAHARNVAAGAKKAGVYEPNPGLDAASALRSHLLKVETGTLKREAESHLDQIGKSLLPANYAQTQKTIKSTMDDLAAATKAGRGTPQLKAAFDKASNAAVQFVAAGDQRAASEMRVVLGRISGVATPQQRKADMAWLADRIGTTDNTGFRKTALSAIKPDKFDAFEAARKKFFEKQGANEDDAKGISGFIESVNRLARIGIVTNPAVHILWNLHLNYLAAGGPMGALYKDSWQAHKLVDDTGKLWKVRADEANAIAHMHGGTPMLGGNFGTVVTGPKTWSKEGLAARGPLGTADRILTGATDWNQKVVFDQAESNIATLLFKHYIDTGAGKISDAQAGKMVREALGNYLNVSRTGIEGAMQKALFFYPWLKTIIPFWIKTGAIHPATIAAPVESIYNHNVLAGDPNADKATNPFRWFTGNDRDGNPNYQTLPFPQRIIGDLLNIAAPKGDLQGPLQDRMGAIGKVLSSHLNPIAGAAADTVTTVAGPARPTDDSNFNTVFDKMDPNVGEQALQAGKYALRKVPFEEDVEGVGKTVGAGAQGLLHGNLGDAVRPLGSALGGFAYPGLSPDRQRMMSMVRARFQKELARANYIVDPVQRREEQSALWKAYLEQSANIRQEGQK